MDFTLGGYWIKFSKYQISYHASCGFNSQIKLLLRSSDWGAFDNEVSEPCLRLFKQNSPRSDVVKIGCTQWIWNPKLYFSIIFKALPNFRIISLNIQRIGCALKIVHINISQAVAEIRSPQRLQ